MIRRLYRGTLRFLKSAVLVSSLLAFTALWSVAASIVPQGDASDSAVVAWAAANPVAESIVQAAGLHQAFTAYIFLACAAVLALSTVLCSWQRTKAAMKRTRLLLRAGGDDPAELLETHDLEVPCGSRHTGTEALELASETLAVLGIRTKRKGDLLVSASSALSVWGSPLFHWALVALMAAILVGNLQRSDGMIGLAVGQTKPDTPASYGVLTTGPWHDFGSVHRSFRLDAFALDFKADGIDRGPVPTVSVLDGEGAVVKTQPVYPNMMLHVGSLSISSPAYGLSVELSVVDTNGAEIGRTTEPVDFAQDSPDGTVPLELLAIYNADGSTRLLLHVAVPLDRGEGRFVEWMPSSPSTRVIVNTPDGVALIDRTLKAEDSLDLPGGGRLILVGVGWYARLSIVDDWTIPVIYTCMVIAIMGLAISVLLRQQLLIATVVEGPDGPRLVAVVRLWRNASTSRGEIESELARAFSCDEEGSAS